MCLRVRYKKKNVNIYIFFASLKALKKRVDTELDPDPLGAGLDPHQNVTDPQPALPVGFGRATSPCAESAVMFLQSSVLTD